MAITYEPYPRSGVEYYFSKKSEDQNFDFIISIFPELATHKLERHDCMGEWFIKCLVCNDYWDNARLCEAAGCGLRYPTCDEMYIKYIIE